MNEAKFVEVTQWWRDRYDKLAAVRERLLHEADLKSVDYKGYIEGVLDMFNETSKILEEL